jgi:solute carrier family 35, member F5
MIPLIPMLLKHLWDDRGQVYNIRRLLQQRVGRYKFLRDHETDDDGRSKASRSRSRSPATELLLGDETRESEGLAGSAVEHDTLTLGETVKLSVEFWILWVGTTLASPRDED